MKIICFPHFYYLSEVSRLVEMGQALRGLGQEVLFFSHGGQYEYVAQEAGFEVTSVAPHMSSQRAADYMAFQPGREGRDSGRVLLTPHVPVCLVNPLADIAITHGGAGTAQTAVHSGTPLVGIRMRLEQTGNLSMVMRQRAGLTLSKWDLNRRSLERLLTDASLRQNMLCLKALQDKVDGAAVAAKVIVRYLGARW